MTDITFILVMVLMQI